MPNRPLRICLSAILTLAFLLSTQALTFAGSFHSLHSQITSSASTNFASVDPNYIYGQLFYMVTHFQRREAGYDQNLPVTVNGHDEFATYWTQEMLRNLQGFGAQARRDAFPVNGWRGRPAMVPAFNVEVTVPGVIHPDQVVVIGCHYDGEAVSTQSANDDGSGCAIELGVAQAMAAFWRAQHVYPARTLRFVIFDAEEQGLYGSFHYVNDTVNGDTHNIVAMFNEEQNGIAYPLRYLGSLLNPLMPFYIDMSPLSNNGLYAQQDRLSPQQKQAITRFRTLMQQAVVASFQQFYALGYQLLSYHSSSGQDVFQPIFTPDQTSNVIQEDDTSGGSDQIPFTLAGIPCATFIGNSTYYDPNHHPPGSYPYDQPQDTIQLMNTFASGGSQKSYALALALGLPGMLTSWMLSQPDILGQSPADGKPVVAISSIGQTTPGKPMGLDANAAFLPGQPSGTFTYAWNFGDGTTASGPTVNHTYNSPGTYTLTLTASTPTGAARVVRKILNVGSKPTGYDNPYAHFQPSGHPGPDPLVTLPTPDDRLTDKVMTLAKATATPVTIVSTNTTTLATSSKGNTGLSVWLFAGLGLLVVLCVAGIALGVRRRRRQL